MLQRKGDAITRVVENTSQKRIDSQNIRICKRDYTVLYTDEWLGYNAVDKMFYHYSVDHGKGKYVDGRIYTNTIEGFWSIFKRGIIGIYHHISKKHLQLYANEFTFRYNTRKIKDSSKFKLLLRNSYFKNNLSRYYSCINFMQIVFCKFNIFVLLIIIIFKPYYV